MPDTATITLTLPAGQAWALAELVKRLDRSELGPEGLNLTNPHQAGEREDAGTAVRVLARALAEAGFEPR